MRSLCFTDWRGRRKSLTSLRIVAFFTALACYTLQISSVSIPYTPHVFELTLAATVVLGLIAPTKAFYGPLRLGYLQHSTFFFQTYEIFLNWWLGAALLSFLFPILSSSLFPFIALTILGVFAAAWFYVYQEYRKKLQDVVRQSAESTSRAALAADYAREYANSARQYERQMLEVLAATRRDVLLANSVKLTDFFDVAVESWAALERVTNPFSEVTKKVEEIIDAAYEVEDLEKPTRGGNKEEDYDDEGDDDTEKPSDDDDDDDDEEGDDNGLSELAEELVDTAKGAIKAVKQVDSKLRIARRAVLTSREAKNQTTKARNQAVTNAKGATSTTDNLLREVAGILENCFNASQGAENARGYAEKAVAAATLGEMQDAANLAASAKSAADNVVKIKDALKTTRDKARECLVGALRTLSA